MWLLYHGNVTYICCPNTRTHTHTHARTHMHAQTTAEASARVSLFTAVTKGDNLPPDLAVIHTAAAAAAAAAVTAVTGPES